MIQQVSILSMYLFDSQLSFQKNEIRILHQLWIAHNNGFPPYISIMEKFTTQGQILLEYMSKGTLLNQVLFAGRLEEKYARNITIHIYHGLCILHQYKIAHLDLKPDNIMFDSNSDLKICDFGYSNNPVGYTQGYAPPEQVQQSITNIYKCDIFSFGVIIFILVMGFPPFQEANANDFWFKLIQDNNYEEFWRVILKRCNYKPTTEFMRLFEKMTTYDPALRYELKDITQSNWFFLETATESQCKQLLNQRFNSYQQIQQFNL